jgi:hypothetical protein
LHTVAEVADIQIITGITETLEAWDQVTEIKTEAVQAAEAELTLDKLTAEAAEAADLVRVVAQQDVQQQQMELDHLVVWVDMVMDLEHLVEDQEHPITGLHGLVLVVQVETAHMELQVAEAAAQAQAVEDLVAVAQEAHKQQITQVAQAWTEQVQAEAEIITQVETVKREVLA